MGTRILIHVAAPAQGQAELPSEARQVLEGAGAAQIRASHPELPGLFTAIVPDGVNVPELVEKLRQSPGIRHAETDQLRGTM
jgi:hypothetical protein